MFRSVSTVIAVAAATATGGVAPISGAEGAAPTAVHAATPTSAPASTPPLPPVPAPTTPEPTPTPTAAPSPGRPPARAPIVDITAPALDIALSTSTLDGSLIDVRGGRQQKVIVAADVLFAFDRADLTPAAKDRLDAVAARLRANATGRRVAIDGHTDSKGSTAYNKALSRRRAEAVRKALEKLLAGSGITFVVKGHGAAKPIAPNTKDGRDYPEGRAKNRRVEITYRR